MLLLLFKDPHYNGGIEYDETSEREWRLANELIEVKFKGAISNGDCAAIARWYGELWQVNEADCWKYEPIRIERTKTNQTAKNK